MYLHKQWEAAINDNNLDAVVGCYAPTALLLPTVSALLCDTPEKIRDYFVAFLSKKPQVIWIDSYINEFSDGYVQLGRYEFRFDNGMPVIARYTFAYKKIDGLFNIVSHHSSRNPD